jgi:cytochrome c oxidase assembly protein Cox11
MKNRRTIVMAFLLCACLIVGMGYAAITDTININGTASFNAAGASADLDANVYVSKVNAKETNCGVDVTVGTTTDKLQGKDAKTYTAENNVDTITVSVINTGVKDSDNTTMAVKGDSTTFTFEITNDSNTDVTVAHAVENTKDGDVEISITGDATIASGKTGTYTVTIKIVNTPEATETAATEEFKITTTVTAVDGAATNA